MGRSSGRTGGGIDHHSLANRRDEAYRSRDLERTAELSREPNVHLGPQMFAELPGEQDSLDPRRGPSSGSAQVSRGGGRQPQVSTGGAGKCNTLKVIWVIGGRVTQIFSGSLGADFNNVVFSFHGGSPFRPPPDSTESEEYRRLNLQLFLGHPSTLTTTNSTMHIDPPYTMDSGNAQRRNGTSLKRS